MTNPRGHVDRWVLNTSKYPTSHTEAYGTALARTTTFTRQSGTNLLVVDNSTNVMHYYTVEPGKEVGEELHLRGSIDLNEVGKPSVKPKVVKKANPGGGR